MVKIEENIDLKKYNTYGIGGKARYFVLATKKKDLIGSYIFAKEKNIPLIILGGGSNVVISDNGFDGFVVVNKASEIGCLGNRVKASSGLTLAKMIKFTTNEGLTGAEFLAGIPGTLGGAISGNAGAWGKSIGDILESVEFLDEKGIKQIDKENFNFGYRTSSLKNKGGIILSATLVLKKDSLKKVEKRVSEILEKRKGKHPQGRTCGSFFKNIETSDLPPEIHDKIRDWEVSGKVAAGKLIEETGCKGMKVGGAQVSEVHANFLINTGDATANDIKELAQQVKKRAYDKFGIELEPEVRYL